MWDETAQNETFNGMKPPQYKLKGDETSSTHD